MIRSMLVAFDGSDYAEKALDLACDLASKYGARLVLLHVALRDIDSATIKRLADQTTLTEEQRHQLESYETDMETDLSLATSGFTHIVGSPPLELLGVVGNQILAHAEEKAKSANVKEIEKVIVGGDPADEILSYAAKNGIDAIVMGTRGLGDFKGFILGSVSHKVAARAECTCITVK